MRSSEDPDSLDPRVEAAEAPEHSAKQKETSPADMLRIKQQMSNQCFEMTVHLNAGKNKRPCSTSEAGRELPEYMRDLEKAKAINFNGTLVLHRMQMWHAIAERLKEADSNSDALKAMSDRCMGLCSLIKQLQQESKTLQDEVTEIQKNRLELKRLTKEKMRLMEELLSKKEPPDSEKYKAVLEKGRENLEKYKKMAVMTQGVLRGMLLACNVNWMDDPEVRAIAMTLEELPFSD